MNAPAVSMQGIEARIGGHAVLQNVTLEVPAGSTLGLVGESGSGKSLTLRVLLGLLDRIGCEVTSGTAEVEGQDVLRMGPRGWRALRGHRIGFVPQNSSALLNPVRRIGAQLGEAVRRLDPAADREGRVLELLEAVRIARPADVRRMYPHEVSGGTLQRVMIALAIAGRPRLLIADEPTTALDVTVQKAVLELFNDLKADFAMSMVFVSHDLGVVRAVSDEVAVMYAGSTVESGPADRVLTRPQHPYSQALVAAHPGPGRQILAGLAGSPPSVDDRPDGCQFAPRCDRSTDACTAAPVPLLVEGLPWPVACLHPSSGGAA